MEKRSLDDLKKASENNSIIYISLVSSGSAQYYTNIGNVATIYWSEINKLTLMELVRRKFGDSACLEIRIVGFTGSIKIAVLSTTPRWSYVYEPNPGSGIANVEHCFQTFALQVLEVDWRDVSDISNWINMGKRLMKKY